MLPLPIDPAVRANCDARQNPHTPFGGIAAQVLRRFNPAMRVAQKAIDHNGRNFVLAAKIDTALIIAQKARGGLAIGVKNPDLLLANLRQFPVGGMIPCPKGAIGQAGGLGGASGVHHKPRCIRASFRQHVLDPKDNP